MSSGHSSRPASWAAANPRPTEAPRRESTIRRAIASLPRGALLAIVLLHAAGIALVAGAARDMPALPGLAVIAYLLGVRHAFDVDHIAAIDNATRRLCGRRSGPSATGFFFSLGHSTVVLVAVAVVATAVHTSAGGVGALPALGGTFGGAASATFLLAIGVVNLAALLGRRSHRHVAGLRGPLTTLLAPVFRRVTAEWHMYVVGAAFGLGFDTASEVGLLALAASPGAAAPAAVVALPLLFAAGMSLFDTVDGVLIGRAYRWSAADDHRRARYVTTMTVVSAAVALAVGTVEAFQLVPRLAAAAPPSLTEAQSQLGGIAVTAVLVLVWIAHVRRRPAPAAARPATPAADAAEA